MYVCIYKILFQGSAADICKAAMISTEQKLKRFNCKLLLQIHDELVWEVADSELDQVKCKTVSSYLNFQLHSF